MECRAFEDGRCTRFESPYIGESCPIAEHQRFAYWRTGTHAADAAMRMIHNRRRACSASDAMPMSQTDMKRQWNPMMSDIFDKKV